MLASRSNVEDRASLIARLTLWTTDIEQALILKAYQMAEEAHDKQLRESGERYFEHIRAVTLILIDELQIHNVMMIIVALLHDTREDSRLFSVSDIFSIFGMKINDMIDTLTMPSRNRFGSKPERLEYYHQKINKALIDEIVVKLCDRLHNIRTLHHCEPEKIKRKIAETREHYLPLIARVKTKYPEAGQVLEEQFAIALDKLEE